MAKRDASEMFEDARSALDDLIDALDSVTDDGLDQLRSTLSSITSSARVAADAVQAVGNAGDAAGNKGAKGILTMAQAMEKLKKQQAKDEVTKKNEETMRSAAKAMGLNNDAADKLIGKRRALQDALGGAAGNMLNAAQQMGGPLGNIASKVSNIGSLFGRVPPQVAVVLVLVAALSAAVGGLVVMLHKAAETALEVVGKINMMRSVLTALHSSASAGGGIMGLVDRLAGPNGIPFATEKIGEWAKSLSMAARNGKELESMIRSVAAAQALMGDSGASAAQSMLETLGRGGAAAASLVAKLKSGTPEAREELAKLGLKSIDLANALGVSEAQFRRMRLSAEQMNQAVQKALQKKGAGPLEEMALSLPVMLMRIKEGFLSLFSDLGPSVKPFMQALKALFGEFSKGGDGIKALKPIVTSVMQVVFAVGTWAVRGLMAAWQMMKPHVMALAAAIQRVTSNSRAMGILKSMLSPIATAFLQIVAVITVVIDYVTMLINAFDAVATEVGGAFEAISGLGEGAASAASNFVSGLVSGISAGAGAVADAVKGLASTAMGAFTGFFGIKSPSTKMLEHGEENIAGAAATGVEAGTPRVAKAMAKMGEGEPGAGGKAKGGARVQAGGGGGERHYHYHGPMSDYATFKRYVTRYWEEAELEAGSAPEPA